MATKPFRPGRAWPVPAPPSGIAAAVVWGGLAAALLLWPAAWNRYPIVFADTGTYLSQAVHRYAGWDRPIFYSLFILPLHGARSLWPIVVVQALLAVAVLRVACRTLLPGLTWPAFTTAVALLSALTWLPFLTSEVMPDLFTPLLILVTIILAWAPDEICGAERWTLIVLAGFMTSTQQSSIPLVLGLIVTLAPLAVWRRRLPARAILPATIAPLLALAALCTANFAAHHRLSPSPFGNVFYLARLIADGPAAAELRRDCPARDWRLCPYVDRLPADSDEFLWAADSPLVLAGGAKMVSADASEIIAAAVRNDPLGVAAAALDNTGRQLTRFASGDGLEPWTRQVTPWLARGFPMAEQARYTNAMQQRGLLILPPWLKAIHVTVGVLGIAACAVMLPGALHRRLLSAGFLLGVLLALPMAAAITGALSAPHDRYQARIMWLPPFIGGLCFAASRRRDA